MPTYLIVNSERHLVDTLTQVRSISRWRYLRIFAGALAVIGVAIGGRRLWPGELAISTFVVGFVGLVFFWPRPAFEVRRQALRKSPTFNQETMLEVSDSGTRWSAPGQTTEQDWRHLDRVVRRPRGFLLYARSGSVTWWPDQALAEGTAEEVETILRGKAASFLTT